MLAAFVDVHVTRAVMYTDYRVYGRGLCGVVCNDDDDVDGDVVKSCTCSCAVERNGRTIESHGHACSSCSSVVKSVSQTFPFSFAHSDDDDDASLHFFFNSARSLLCRRVGGVGGVLAVSVIRSLFYLAFTQNVSQRKCHRNGVGCFFLINGVARFLCNLETVCACLVVSLAHWFWGENADGIQKHPPRGPDYRCINVLFDIRYCVYCIQ